MPVHKRVFQNAPIASVASQLLRTKVRSYCRRRFIGLAVMLAFASLGIVTPATAQIGGHPATSVVSGKLGIFTHYIPYASNISGYNAVVNAFDVNAYANDVATSGAKYVTFTLGQNGYFCAPNNTLNSLCGTVTTTRGLIGEIADALNAKGIKLIVYIPSDAPDIMKSRTGYQATGRNQVFQENWQNVMREYSQRWGTKVAGWWVDGMYRWEEMYAFAQPPNHQSFTAALKAGNASAILAFNDGRGPYSNHSQYGDTNYVNTGLTNGTTYYYKFKAVNSAGSSAYSNEASAKPVVPSGNGINLSVSLVAGQVTLIWTSNVPNVAYFTVYRGTTSGGQGATPLDYPSATPWTDNFSPNSGTRYYYVLRAVDIYGDTSAPSNEVSIVP